MPDPRLGDGRQSMEDGRPDDSGGEGTAGDGRKPWRRDDVWRRTNDAHGLFV